MGKRIYREPIHPKDNKCPIYNGSEADCNGCVFARYTGELQVECNEKSQDL